jgi:cyclic-di-AMP phosphodiesterase
MQIDTNQIQKLISEASNVVIMAHRNLDLDALGSSLGVYYLCKKMGKNSFLLIEEKKSEMGVSRSLAELDNIGIKINIKKLPQLKLIIDDRTLLIMMDVHLPELTQNDEVFKLLKNVMIIDHHIKDKDVLAHVNYEYIAENKSSTSEIIVNLLEELNIYIPPYVATIMLAGIVIDTNRFAVKTTNETYDSAAFLYQCGADPKEMQYLLKEDMAKYICRQKVISEAKIIGNKYAIGIGSEDKIYYKEDLAKISDILLLFNNIEAAFTIAKIEDNIIGISARSLGNIDVQKIMEQLDGGGRITDAATQLKNTTIEEAKRKLIGIIEKL